MITEINELINEAKELGACKIISAEMDLTTLSNIFFSPQGLEFCSAKVFPSIHMFRRINGMLEPYSGFFVDRGRVEINNETPIAIIGDTDAIIRCSDEHRVHKIVVMHGAKAEIYVDGYSVVRLYNIRGGEITIHKSKNAVILR